jgi:hypothetical protein
MLVVLAASGAAQEKGRVVKMLEVNEANVLGTWWVKHDLGSLDGYQLGQGGKLTLVNLYSWHGEEWKLHKDTMTWVMFADNQKPETARYLVSNLTSNGFSLKPLTSNAGEKTISLHKHTGKRVTDAWVGRWVGAGGTFLDIVPDSANYKIMVQDSSKLREYRGSAENDRIKFTRNSVVEYIAAVDGKSTGVESLEKKKNCLAIKKGEGYYRD